MEVPHVRQLAHKRSGRVDWSTMVEAAETVLLIRRLMLSLRHRQGHIK